MTTDGRFCKACLGALVRRLSPGSTVVSRRRHSDKQQAFDSGEPSPWGENAVRALEGD